MTAEEFERLLEPDDGTRLELIRGEVGRVVAPGAYRDGCCLRVRSTLGSVVEARHPGHLTTNNVRILLERNPDTVRVTDVALWRRERVPALRSSSVLAVVPDVVVDVLRPGVLFSQVFRKVYHYFAVGVPVFWIV